MKFLEKHTWWLSALMGLAIMLLASIKKLELVVVFGPLSLMNSALFIFGTGVLVFAIFCVRKWQPEKTAG